MSRTAFRTEQLPLTNTANSSLIHICLSCDDRYAPYCGVTIASILNNAAPEDHLIFYILDGGISAKNKAKFGQLQKIKPFEIHFFSIRLEDFKNCPIRNGDHVSLATYYRLKIPSILPRLDKVIYLDCDVLANGSLGALYEENIDKYAVGMVPESADDAEGHKKRLGLQGAAAYCNGGVLLINCKLWRDRRLSDRCFEFVAQHSNIIKFQDQDVLNIVLRGEIKELDRQWNVMCSPVLAKCELENPQVRAASRAVLICSESDIETAKIVHYFSQAKAWSARAIHPATQQYYDYLKITPWHQWWQVWAVRAIANLRIARRWLRLRGL